MEWGSEVDRGLLPETLHSLGLGPEGWGLCLAGLQSPHQGQPLALAWALRQWLTSPCSCLCDLVVVAVCLGHSLWDLVSPLWVA